MLDYSYPNTPPDQRGWGAGYPHCDESRWQPLTAKNGVSFGRVDARLNPLLERLLNECIKRGYPPKNEQCWGSVCRCSHRSDGTCATDSAGHEIPSNHSFGIAIDFNSLDNVYGASTYKMPSWVPKLFHAYGFRWLGPPIHDWQHFDFAGSPHDASDMYAKAKANNLGEPDRRFKVGTRVFRKLRKALEYARRQLRRGHDVRIVVKGGD